jgi:hypothetical protein
MRAVRELEPPGDDEGFADVAVVPFTRTHTPGRPGVFVAAAALLSADRDRPSPCGDAPHLVFDWNPDGDVDALAPLVTRLRTTVAGPVDAALCPHGAGPPRCWCRPPLPGLALAFAQAHGVDPSRSVLVGISAAHRTLATTLGAGYVHVP